MDIPGEWIAGIGVALGAGIPAGARVLWRHWQKREERLEKAHADTVEAKDDDIVRVSKAHEELVKSKNAQIDQISEQMASDLAVKDSQIAHLTTQIGVVVSQKRDQIAMRDAQIEELSKKLSVKSDDHSKTVERLMTVTLAKVEEWSDKQLKLQDRAFGAMSEFSREVQKLNVGMSGFPTPNPPPSGGRE